MAMAVQALPTVTPIARSPQRDLSQWEGALRQVARGSYGECRNAVRQLKLLSRDLQEELETDSHPRNGPADPAERTLRAALASFQSELRHFNSRGRVCQLLPAGRRLLESLTVYAD